MKIGIMALQGAYLEHSLVLHELGVEAVEVRLPGDIINLDGLGLPVLGTCAGMICLAKRVFNSQDSFLNPLEVMDIVVKRNAFGRQVDSFEADLEIPDLGKRPYHAVFIRAPRIDKVGPGVKVLAMLPDGTIVAARQDNILVSSFHPELTDDLRFHRYFLKLIKPGGKKHGR
ncbi:MAG: glutamine amidotransferase, family [Chloroflexi bacterium]|nr:glutamine amidotransferase, family [Chloroflexota bacterium]